MHSDREYMHRALQLAARGRGKTSPNPLVGCVVVMDDRIVGEGYHERCGEAHAEINAVNAVAGGSIHGATVYVTLEPCAHHGKTPPCCEFLIARGPARVVVAMTDPNPLVCGKGIAAMRAAGITVDVGEMEDEARRLNEVFIKYISTGRPFVIAKCAMSLDGKIATRTGHSQWITSLEARTAAHELRGVVDAILVGSATVRNDNPSLTNRLAGYNTADPTRIVLDSGSGLAPDLKVFTLESTAPTWVVTTEARAYPGAGEVIVVPRTTNGADLAAMMDELGSRQITSLLIEGGGKTLGSAFAAGLVDKVCFFIAPKIIGGREAPTPVEGDGAERVDLGIALRNMEVSQVGADLLVTAYVEGK
ncbi:MAG: bifunctional diaminohydroxyphosphoribosylaminopyrimidine deaminase/5-amino-6-(5-phosphoribosylamino)uracil reductase RibD [Candidatus Hydrogenedentes bacterium]|nr:bifunctional diaminohydroxyphosphoribosylaminopyrimidine deaminase/5-amino-6-(5-phosphoribosylamino)uracil reductase RibD [Candidatus Hydrogenedentota bacterium]